MVEKRLNNLQIVRLKVPGLYNDGGGLILQVTLGKDGSPKRSWLFRYSLRARPHQMGLGSFEYVSLAEARAARDRARALILQGIDPIEARAAKPQITQTMTFDQCAASYFKTHAAGWRSEKHRRQWTSTLARHASPVFGSTSIAAVDTGLVMRVLTPLWKATPQTANRVRARVEVVLDSAKAFGLRSGENPARWRGHLDQLLPAWMKVQPVEHMSALPYREIPAIMSRLQDMVDLNAAKALMFTILTAARTAEVIGATWAEINLETGTWAIPPTRMKTRREHRVPLSEPASAVLVCMSDRSGFLFPSATGRKMHPDCMRLLLRDMCVGATVHGMRSSFRDWCGEETDFPREIAEAALAHAMGGEVEIAYRRGDALAKRRALMDLWAAFVSIPVLR